jgi:hypothetical protein
MNSDTGPIYLVDVHAGSAASVPACPRCGGLTQRTRRRWVDRLLSRVRPLRRYACRSCSWVGNVQVRGSQAPPDTAGVSPRRNRE